MINKFNTYTKGQFEKNKGKTYHQAVEASG